MRSLARLALACVAIGAETALIAQTAPPITVYVTVKTGDGTQVETSLKQDAFQIRSDATLVPIESFALTPVPLTMVALFDLTASVVRGPASDRQTLAAFEAGVIEQLAPGDRVRAGGISSASVFSPRFASAKEDIRTAAAAVFQAPAEHRYGPSPIWDTVASAIDLLEKEPGRRVIVAHTDGISIGDRLRRQDVVVRAAAAGVTLMVVAPPGPRADMNLRSAAHSTGGTFLVGLAPRLAESFAQVLTDLRSSYALTFTPPAADGKLHRLDVRVAGRFHAVLARQIYRAPEK